MSNGINSLNIPTINGLQNLSLDNLDVGTIDGDLFYIDRIEASEIILDRKLTMNNNSWFNVNGTTVSNIELSYLDNCNSNIQTQINNVNTGNTNLQTQINTHTGQITSLQSSDTTQNSTLSTHTTQITALQTSDATQNTAINNINNALNSQSTYITNLQTSDTSQNTRLTNIETLNTTQNTRLTNIETLNTTQNTSITTLQNKTVFQTATSTATEFSKQINLPNGNIGYVNPGQPNNFYIQSNLASGNNIYIKSGQANILLQAQNVYLGKTDAISGRKSNLFMLASDGTTWEQQSSAFTEALKTNYNNYNTTLTTHTSQITALQASDSAQNTTLSNLDSTLLTIVNNISTLQSKTQNIFSANSTNTIMNKPLQIENNGESLKMIGTNTNIAGYDSTTGTRDYALGNASSSNKKINLIVDKQDSLNFISGTNASNLKGRNDINCYSNGIKFYRGWVDAGNTLEYSGAIGQLNPSLPHFFIANNSTNPIYIDAGISSITLNSNTIWISGQIPAGNGRYSNLNMLNSTGTAWETQSSAFTETIKEQITTNQNNITALQNTLNNSKTAIARINYSNGNVFLLGRTTTLNANFNYPTETFVLKVGPLLNTGGYSAFFNSNGNWIYNSSQRVNFQFDMEFNGLDTGIKAMVSRFVVTSSGGGALLQSSRQGVRYNSGSGNPLYTTLYYSTGNFVFDISYGDIVSIETENWFSTSSLGGSVTTTGRLTFYLSQF